MLSTVVSCSASTQRCAHLCGPYPHSAKIRSIVKKAQTVSEQRAVTRTSTPLSSQTVAAFASASFSALSLLNFATLSLHSVVVLLRLASPSVCLVPVRWYQYLALVVVVFASFLHGGPAKHTPRPSPAGAQPTQAVSSGRLWRHKQRCSRQFEGDHEQVHVEGHGEIWHRVGG